MQQRCLLTGAVFLVLCCPLLRAQDSLLITEFQAFNVSTLQDEDGDYSDWIEFYNAGSQPFDLTGHYLTDNPDNLTKWEFPAMSLDPGAYLLVFASEKDRRDAGDELHSNFRLERNGGEPLAVIAPNGMDVVVGYVPEMPAQVADASYGLATNSVVETPIFGDSPVRVLVPENGNLGTSWMTPGFDAGSWRAGTGGVGYERSSGYELFIGTDVEGDMYDQNASCYIRYEFNVTDASEIDVLTSRIRYDDGFALFLNGTRIASANAPAGASLPWDADAERSNSDQNAVRFETFDLSAARSELVDGLNVLAVQALNFNPTSSDFLFQCELELVDQGPIDSTAQRWFDVPTPAGPNRGGFATLSPRPIFSRDRGSYVGAFNLVLSTEALGAEIRYTLDGTRPDETSTLYTGPISITSTAFVNARVYQPGAMPGQNVLRSYMIVHSELATRTSDVPYVLIDSFGISFDSISQSRFQEAYIQTIERDPETGRAALTGPADFVGRGGIKIRGSSSAGFPKKQYAMEIWDESDEDRNVSLLDMPSQSDWILYAPFSDKSLMRNALSYEWSNTAGRYAVRTRYVEVYFNDRAGNPLRASNYLGVFVLMEKIKRDDSRVDIERLEPTDTEAPEITGGYILKKDRLDPGDSGLTTSRGQRLAFVYPKEDQISPEQVTYIRTYLNTMEAALYGANFRDPDVGYRAHIDVGSFIDHHIMVELTKNIDGYRLSTFMYKDRGGKLHMGPIWDYNLSLGNADYLQGWIPTGWYYPQVSSDQYPWYPRLFQDADFAEQYRQRWVELRATVFTKSYLLGSVDRHADELRESQARNFQRWRILGRRDWPNWHIPDTWQEELDWMRNDWLDLRIDWIDSQFVESPEFDPPGGGVDEGTLVQILGIVDGGDGAIWYTTDDSDPLGAGQQPSPSAVRYTEPIVVNDSVRINARIVLGDGFWSPMATATYSTDVARIRVTELMYNPPSPTLAEDPEDRWSATSMEYIEVRNVDDEDIDLTQIRLTRGVTFDFSEGMIDTLAPGDYAVVVQNLDAFEARYGDSLPVAGQYTGSFSNRTETVVLADAFDIVIQEFRYQDSWYPETDGLGSSLEIIDDSLATGTWNDAESWRASPQANGSPGEGAVEPPQGGLQVSSDISQDGQLDISDAVGVLGHLFQGSPASLPCGTGGAAEASNISLLDADGNGLLDLTDAIRILSFLFQGATPPVLGIDCRRIIDCPDACSI